MVMMTEEQIGERISKLVEGNKRIVSGVRTVFYADEPGIAYTAVYVWSINQRCINVLREVLGERVN